MLGRLLAVGTALLLAAACAQGETRAYGGRGEDALLEMAQAGNGLFAVGTTASTDGDLSVRTRSGQAGWAMRVDEDGVRMWSYASAHTGYARMTCPAALEDGRFSLVLTDEGAQSGEWLLLGAAGDCLARTPVPAQLCGDERRTVRQFLLCGQAPAALAVILWDAQAGTLCAGVCDEDGGVRMGAPFLGGEQGCAASDLHGGLVWMEASDGAIHMTRLSGVEPEEAMAVSFADGFAVTRLSDAMMLGDGSAVCCGAARATQGQEGFVLRLSREGEVIFCQLFDAEQRCLCQTETGFAAYGQAETGASVAFLDEDGNLLGMAREVPMDAQDMAGMPGGVAILTNQSGRRQPQAVITPVSQGEAPEQPETEAAQASATLLAVEGGQLVCAPDGALGVQVTYVDSAGREAWTTRMPIHTAADELEWLCAMRMADGRILLGGRYISGEGGAARQQGALALLGGDGVLRSLEAVPGCGAVLAMAERADGVTLRAAPEGALSLTPDRDMDWRL